MADRDNNGTISKNKRKEKENQPDLRGSATIGGVEYWLAGWQKSGSDGIFYSLAFSPKDEQAANGRRPVEEDSDDIPF